MPFTFEETHLPGIIKITPRIFEDSRGLFFEDYKQSEFRDAGIMDTFVQGNHSRSGPGVIRGLHYQLNPHAQGKLVHVIKGCAWDVAVDIRVGSPHYGKWTAVELTESNRVMLYLPPGFAHGFTALTDDVEICYKVTSEYSPEHEAGIRWDDPTIGIDWPLASPLLSDKDRNLPLLNDAANNFIFNS